MKTCICLLVLFVCSSPFSLADDEGHRHEDMTEAQVGTVQFPSSCASVQKPIERGVAMLHSFWYEEAEKQFQQIEKDDPQCAIAHWGVAMSIWHQLWNRPDRPTLERGGSELKQARALKNGTARERGYISALSTFYAHPGRAYQKRVTAYSKAMEKVSRQNADDHEARFELASAKMAAGNRDSAADELLELIRRDREWNEGAGRKRFLQLLEAQGLEDPWSSAQRRRLSAVLFT